MIPQILILDFGSQYTQLIARRIRELNVFCEIHPFNKIPDYAHEVKGLILSGSPCSVRDADSPRVDWQSFSSKMPVLGVCYGAQLLAQENGGTVAPSASREYGRAHIQATNFANHLFDGIPENSQVWMSHADTISVLPSNATLLAFTSSIPVAAFQLNDTQT